MLPSLRLNPAREEEKFHLLMLRHSNLHVETALGARLSFVVVVWPQCLGPVLSSQRQFSLMVRECPRPAHAKTAPTVVEHPIWPRRLPRLR
jgi:hypothetical protein